MLDDGHVAEWAVKLAIKLLPHLPISEENPLFGVAKYSRYARSAGDFLDPGASDAARANAETANLRILLSMISSLDEMDEACRLIAQSTAELRELVGMSYRNRVSA
ncbi:MAG: putative PEP-binding protein [Symbiopectobacterium sp.]